MAATSLSILTLTVAATGTIAQHRFVTPAGLQTGAGENAIGSSLTAAVSGNKIPVMHLGIATVEAGAAVSAGASLKADADGKAITWATSGAKLGIARTAAAASGDLIEVLLIPNLA